MVGRTLSRYRIVRLLGRGAMGEVYAAEDAHLGRQIAVKLLPAELCCDQAATDRFTREARIVSSLNHPHICTLHDFGQHEGRYFMVMELLEGEPLNSRVARGLLPIDEVLAFGSDVADALDAAHRQGVVHRDIKPANLFVTSRGDIKVLDFGVAKLATANDPIGTTRGDFEPTTSSGTAIGTVAYMSPEQARGEVVDGRSDLFSLGVVLYEMATGRRPFPGKTPASVFEGILTKTPSPASALRPDLPGDLDRVLARALEKDPELRYQTAADLRADLERLRRDTSVGHGGVRSHGRRPRWQWWLAVPGATAAAVAGIMAWQATRTPALEARDAVVLAELANRTGDPAFDDTLGEALAVQLRQSPFLNVVAEPRVQATLGLMQRPPDTPISEDVGRDLCQRVGARALLTGAIASLGSGYVLTLRALDCLTGEILAERQAEASHKEDVLRQLGSASSAFREQLGESLASVTRFDAPVEEATTSSLDALKAYSQAMVARRIRGERAAIPLLRRAVELDPDFALAHARLGTTYANLGDIEESKRHTARAFDLRQRVSERERLYIEARYHTSVRPSPDRAIETYRVAIATFPGDEASRINLALLLHARGELAEAIALLQDAATLAPEEPIARSNLADVLIDAGRFDEARRMAEDGLKLRDDGWARSPLLRIAVLTRDSSLEAEQRAWVAARDQNRELLPDLWHVATYRGQLREAMRLLDDMTLVYATKGMPAVASGYQAETAVALALVGLREEAHRLLPQAPGAASSAGTAGKRVVAAALLGDAVDARRWLPLALVDLPDGADTQRSASTLWSLAQSATGAAAGALETLGRVPRQAWEANRVLIHGLLSLDAGRWDEAAKDFEWYRDNRPGEVSPTAGVVRFKLAAAYEGAGQLEAARKAYADFLDFWHTADPDLPLVIEANKALARLGS